MVVDKTGTLTEGKPRVTEVHAAEGYSADQLLTYAASVERGSEHPVAEAIVASAVERGLQLSSAKDFYYFPGKGVSGTVMGTEVAVGNAAMMQERRIAMKSIESRAAQVYVAVDGQLAGAIEIADRVKPGTADVIRDLHREGLKIVMLTGDNANTAANVAEQLGIDDFEAEVLPDQKTAVIKKLQGQGRVVAMAGDGINDAPALAQAHVGIAMGNGTDVAVESAGITLLKGDLRGILRARRLSQATIRNIKQNLFFAFIYNSLGVPIAAGILYPFFGILLSPIIAAAAMSFSSVSVITNSLRLRKVQL
jgi:Cu+-exporting ATPase